MDCLFDSHVVDNFFTEEDYVPIPELRCYSACCKIFQGDTVEFAEKSFANRSILITEKHNILFSLYLNGGEYEKHTDRSVSTALFWLNKEPKKFTGGDLILHDIDKKIDYVNNPSGYGRRRRSDQRSFLYIYVSQYLDASRSV